MRALLTLLIAIWCAPVWAAQPSVVETNTKTATVSNETITLADATAGNGIGVFYILNTSNTRTALAVTDDGGNTYVSQGHYNCGTSRCVELFVDFSVAASAGTLTITVDQSSTFQQYNIVVFEFSCAGTCSLDTAGTGGVTNTTTTSHSMAPSGELDTSANVLWVGACVGDGDFGTRTPTTGFETDTTNLTSGVYWQYEDDQATAFTDERGTWTSMNSRTTQCRAYAIQDVSASSGPKMLIGSGLI